MTGDIGAASTTIKIKGPQVIDQTAGDRWRKAVAYLPVARHPHQLVHLLAGGQQVELASAP
jgi:hypothetical protein